MRPILPRALALAATAAAAAAVAVASSAPALAAPAARGVLTGTEYTQLSAEQTAFKQLEHRKRLTWNEFYAVCRKVGRATGLLRGVRENCDTGVGIDQLLTGFVSEAARCSVSATSTTTGTTTTGTGTTTTGSTTGTTTTGTTTTTEVLTPGELKLFACLQPAYGVIARAARSVYAAQANLRHQVLARDFVGRCRLTLAPTTAQLTALKRFVATSRQLARDVEVISKVADGQAPQSALHGGQIERDSAAFNAAGRAFGRLHRPQKLSVCPHQ